MPSGVGVGSCAEVISLASRRRSAPANLAPFEISLVKRPAITSSDVCRSHHVPWYSSVPAGLVPGRPDRLGAVRKGGVLPGGYLTRMPRRRGGGIFHFPNVIPGHALIGRPILVW